MRKRRALQRRSNASLVKVLDPVPSKDPSTCVGSAGKSSARAYVPGSHRRYLRPLVIGDFGGVSGRALAKRIYDYPIDIEHPCPGDTITRGREPDALASNATAGMPPLRRLVQDPGEPEAFQNPFEPLFPDHCGKQRYSLFLLDSEANIWRPATKYVDALRHGPSLMSQG